jgi:hypothetical protein
MSTLPRIRIVLHAQKDNVPKVLSLAQVVRTAMEANAPFYPARSPTDPVFAAQIAALETAQQNRKSGGINAVATRNAARDVVWSSLGLLRAYVQSLGDASPEQAIVLARSAGMDIARTGSVARPVLDAKLNTVPGTVLLVANAALLTGKTSRQVAFNWQSSADGGHTWISAPSTPRARTSLPGLTLMTTYVFRVSVTVGETLGAWSQSVSLLVH